MKVLILFPNATTVPIITTAVPILAGIAKSRGWEVEYFDTHIYKKEGEKESAKEKGKTGGFKSGFEFDFEYKESNQLVSDLQNRIDALQPDVLAITCISPEYKYLMTFFGKIKIPFNTKVIIGGIHPTILGDEVVKDGLFDVVAMGEGEETFNDILRRVEFHHSLREIPGTYYFDKKNLRIVEKNPPRHLLSQDKLWETERDFSFFDDKYFLRPFDGKKIKRNDVEISRGCPYHCSYCTNTVLKDFNKNLGRYVKTRPIESSIKEMKVLVEKYGIDIFAFADECFLAHPVRWIKEFMDAYVKEIGKPYIFMSRSETITEDKIQILLDYKIPFQVSTGVESGSDDILLNVCDRACTTDKIIPAFEILNKHKIRTNAFFIVGLPFEKREDTLKSIELCRKIKPSVSSVSIYQPYPGQKLTRICLEKGFISQNYSAGTTVAESLLDMPEPYLSKKDITNMWRVFMLYASLPTEYQQDVEKCENDYNNNQELYAKLLKIRWDEFDLSKIKGDIKMV